MFNHISPATPETKTKRKLNLRRKLNRNKTQTERVKLLSWNECFYTTVTIGPWESLQWSHRGIAHADSKVRERDMDVRCDYCSSEITSPRKGQRFCRDECRRDAWRLEYRISKAIRIEPPVDVLVAALSVDGIPPAAVKEFINLAREYHARG